MGDPAFAALTRGDYAIADMAACPWTVSHERQGQDLDDFPDLKRWFETIGAKTATVAASAAAGAVDRPKETSEEDRRILFGQTAASTKR